MINVFSKSRSKRRKKLRDHEEGVLVVPVPTPRFLIQVPPTPNTKIFSSGTSGSSSKKINRSRPSPSALWLHFGSLPNMRYCKRLDIPTSSGNK